MEAAVFDASSTRTQAGLRELLATRTIVLYGAGGFGSRALAALDRAGHRPAAFVDEKKAAASVTAHGLPVLDPWRGQRPYDRGEAVVVISVFNPGVPLGALKQRLLAAGWAHVLDPFELILALGPDCRLDTYWLTHPDRHARHRANIAAGEALFADDASRDLYRRLWSLRQAGDFSRLAPPTTHDVYVPDGLPPLGAQVRMLDCGAYVGDTIDDLAAKGVDLAEIVAFEPDPRNFSRLVARAGDHARRGVRMTLLPCGLAERLEMLRFSSAGEASSALDPHGDATVLCVAIDEVLPEFSATFVKMDIEGAEAAALRGAARTIARCKPRLAISAYHRPDDLWHLPEVVRSIRPDYRLYLRSHAYNGFETVLYAV